MYIKAAASLMHDIHRYLLQKDWDIEQGRLMTP
jgi:hypothetical protein